MVMLMVSLLGTMYIPTPAAAADGAGTVYAHFHGCSNDEAARFQEHEYLKSACDESTYYVSWDLISEGKSIQEVEDADPANVHFDNVPAHSFTLSGQFGIYSGPSVVFCQNGADTSTADGYELMAVSHTTSGDIVHPTFSTSGYVTCDFYGTSAIAETAGTSTVSISSWQCPAGFDIANADTNTLSNSCSTPLNGLDFSVESQLNYKETKTSGVDANGRVFFQYLSADFVQISGVQEAAATPRVFCGGVTSNGSNPLATVEIPANGATFAYNLLDGEDLTCNWFDVQPASAQVYVNVHLCPSGADLSKSDMNALAKSCNQSMNGVAFSIVPENQGATTYQSGETAANGVLWQNLSPGHATVSETPMKGFTPRVFCDQVLPGESSAAHYTERKIGTYSFSTNLDPGEELNCDWFNLNDGGANGTGGANFYAFACPFGFDAANANLKQLNSNCTTNLNDVTFTLAALAGNQVDSTGTFEDGAVIFYDVPAQGAVVEAGPPTDFTTASVYCGQALDYQGNPSAYDKMTTYDTNSIQAEIDPGSQETCRWFFSTDKANAVINPGTNADETPAPDATTVDGQPTQEDEQQPDPTATAIPTVAPVTGGTITITNHICPSGLDASYADVNQLYEQCSGDGSGFGFTLTTEGVSTYQTSGDVIGSGAVWYSVPAHTFTISESLPDGYIAGAVFCTDTTGATSYFTGSVVHPTFPEGASLTCDWFTGQP